MLISRRHLTILLLPAVNNCVHCLTVHPNCLWALFSLSIARCSAVSTVSLPAIPLPHASYPSCLFVNYPHSLPSIYFIVSSTAILPVSRPTVLIVYLPVIITVSPCPLLSLSSPASYYHCLSQPVFLCQLFSLRRSSYPSCLTLSYHHCIPSCYHPCFPTSYPQCLPANWPHCLPTMQLLSLSPPACYPRCLTLSYPCCLPTRYIIHVFLPVILNVSLPAFLTVSLPANLTVSLPVNLTVSLPANITFSLSANLTISSYPHCFEAHCFCLPYTHFLPINSSPCCFPVISLAAFPPSVNYLLAMQ
jgi:hypothetical protein